MKLALICDDYLPNSTRVSAKMMHELAIRLMQLGHEPIVICPNDRFSKNILDISYIDSVAVYKFKCGALKGASKVKRAINESLLSINAWKALSSVIKSEKIDGVVYYSPSIFFGPLVKKIKRLWKCPSYLILRDLFPQWAIDEGILSERSLISKYFKFFERINYSAADYIGLMSERNLELFEKLHSGFKCEVFRNWAEVSPAKVVEEKYVSIRTKEGLQDKIIFFYGGNIGHAQDMSNLMRLVKKMQSHENAHFLFIGQGDEVNLINSLASEWSLSNYSFLPSVTQDEFKCILAEVDVGLFSLSANHTAHNFPGKLLGYMVEELPILGSVNMGNDLMDIVNAHNAGFIHVNGQDQELFDSAIKLFLDSDLRHKIGKNAKQLLIEQFSANSAAQHIQQRLGGIDANN